MVDSGSNLNSCISEGIITDQMQKLEVQKLLSTLVLYHMQY